MFLIRISLFFFIYFFFFFNDTATTEIYTLSLHDALPIYDYYVVYIFDRGRGCRWYNTETGEIGGQWGPKGTDRKSTRLNSSHDQISYAVFCLKKKKKKNEDYVHERPLDTTEPSHSYEDIH